MADIPEMKTPSLPPSLWAATAEPAPPCETLSGPVRSQVAVIGAGYTGLVAALHLAESGRDVVVLDAAEPGWGASGRNGGQVIPGLKDDPDLLEARFGGDAGRRIVETVGGAADELFALIRRHDIACDAVQQGWIQPAHSDAALVAVTARARQWEERGVPVRLLNAEQVHALIGCRPVYRGGWLDPRGGSVQPLSYARGLARAGQRHGVRLFGNARALGLQAEGRQWRISTSQGSVTADSVVLATNGYTDTLWPGLARSVVPVFSQQLATRPLPPELRARILSGGQTASDTRRLLWYYRLDAQGRLIMGGRGRFTDRPAFQDGRRLLEAMWTLFPETRDVEPEFIWAGRVAMTGDHLPHLHRLDRNVFAALGYNGRGVAMATVMGRLLADLVSGTAPERLPYPVTPLRPIPLHALRGPAVRVLVQYYRLLDARDARRQRVRLDASYRAG
ncbi:MAG: FAD-binding oxidoreductase [Ectothiorhodospiraceae bacterium]|nr:FAD-binding oxidoreductase [Ectothiorhodospiraceae bacterium]